MSAPRWGGRFLGWVVPNERREDVQGDLEEAHARRAARYPAPIAWALTWLEVISIAGAFVLYRLRDGEGWGLRLPSHTELLLALRLARRHPGLSLTVILSLATGLGIATAAFAFARGALFADLPFEAGDRFVVLRLYDEEGRRSSLEPERLRHIAEAQTTFSFLGAMRGDVENVRYDDGSLETVETAWITPGAFGLLPYRPLLGRPLTVADGAADATPVAVLHEKVWVSRFGSDPSVVGRTLVVGGARRAIVGVLPEEAEFPNSPGLWLPLRDVALAASGETSPGAITGFGVLREEVAVAEASAQVSTLSAGFDASEARPVGKAVVSPITRPPESALLFTMFGGLLATLALVLAVIAVNVGNLMSARTSARTGELAVRTALGAGRARLVGQLTLEVLVLGLVSASIAWVGAKSFLSWLGRRVDDLPFWIGFDVGAVDTMFLGATTVLVTLVGGCLPALRATRGDPAQALRRTVGGRTTLAPGPGGMLAALEMCISVALIGAAAVTVRGFAGYARPDLDVPVDEILTVRVVLDAPDPRTAPGMAGIVDAARTVPGVRSAGAASALPGLDPPAPVIRLEGSAGADHAPLRAPMVTVTPGFLEALGAAPIAGRLIGDTDLLAGAPAVVVVNEPFVRRFLGGGNPLGRRIQVMDDEADPDAVPEWREVVGVVPDLGMSLGDPAMAAGVYAPMRGDESVGYLTLRTGDDPGGYAQPIRQTLAARYPDALLVNFRTLDQVGSENAVALGVIGGGLTLLGGMALLLSLVSLYALTAFTITRRTREIGIRLALGGSRGSVVRAILGRTGLSMAAGALAGVALGALLLQARSVFVFRIPSGEPWLLPLVGVTMAVAGALASWLPTQRALRIPPVEALRAE